MPFTVDPHSTMQPLGQLREVPQLELVSLGHIAAGVPCRAPSPANLFAAGRLHFCVGPLRHAGASESVRTVEWIAPTALVDAVLAAVGV